MPAPMVMRNVPTPSAAMRYQPFTPVGKIERVQLLMKELDSTNPWEALAELERFEMNIEILSSTGVGKKIARLSRTCQDPYVTRRCTKMQDAWREIILREHSLSSLQTPVQPGAASASPPIVQSRASIQAENHRAEAEMLAAEETLTEEGFHPAHAEYRRRLPSRLQELGLRKQFAFEVEEGVWRLAEQQETVRNNGQRKFQHTLPPDYKGLVRRVMNLVRRNPALIGDIGVKFRASRLGHMPSDWLLPPNKQQELEEVKKENMRQVHIQEVHPLPRMFENDRD